MDPDRENRIRALATTTGPPLGPVVLQLLSELAVASNPPPTPPQAQRGFHADIAVEYGQLLEQFEKLRATLTTTQMDLALAQGDLSETAVHARRLGVTVDNLNTEIARLRALTRTLVEDRDRLEARIAVTDHHDMRARA